MSDDGHEEYDPDQSIQERRELQRGIRDLQRDVNESRDELLKGDEKALLHYINRADGYTKGIKQTGEAAMEARLLVGLSEVAWRRTQRLTSGNTGNGVDVDEFVSKLVTYMKNGGGIEDDNAPELSSTQRQRRRPGRGAMGGNEDDEVGDEGDMLNWAHLGRYACVPHVRRPAVPGFLLGPLSVEKKIRKASKKSAPLRINSLVLDRPEVIQAEGLGNAEKNDLTAICSKILLRLQIKQEEAQDKVAQLLDREALSDADVQKVMDEYGLRSTGGIDLMRFVVNPHSFGQTVENMFYVSFLIRDGRIGIDFDETSGLPALEPKDPEGGEGTGARHSTMKQQAVMSLDMKTWRDIIDAFSIKEPMIEHRRESTQHGPGARGWYS